MNNFDKFYELSGKVIEIFSQSIKKENDNYEYEKKKILNKIKTYSEKDKLDFVTTWQFLIDYAFLCLNREKVENDVTLNWDDYKPKLFNSYGPLLTNKAYSKITYFKDWLRVIDCKDKYLSENSNFWIRKIRNSFLHGNFEYDYNDPQQLVKIFEGTETSTDVKMNINRLAFHEFIDDNFHNFDHDEYGISSSYTNLVLLMNDRITNREQLVDVLKTKFFMLKRKMDTDFYYTGNDIINSKTGEKATRTTKFVKLTFENHQPMLESKEFLNPKADLFTLDKEFINNFVWILENKYNIYDCKKQKKVICQAAAQYGLPMESISRILHEFDSYCGGLTCDKKDYKDIGLDISKMGRILYNYGENIQNAFVILKLCRMMYRFQNKNFNEIDLSMFDSNHFMVVPDYADEEMQKRIEKKKNALTDQNLTDDNKERIALNGAYLETLRNALAHGNIDITYIAKEDKLYPVFSFMDIWTNKRGEKQIVEIRSTTNVFNSFLDTLEMVADNNFKSVEFNLDESINEDDLDINF